MLYIYSQPNNTYFPVQNCFHLFNQFEGGTTWCWLLTRQSTFSSMWQRQVLQLNAGWYIKEILAYYERKCQYFNQDSKFRQAFASMVLSPFSPRPQTLLSSRQQHVDGVYNDDKGDDDDQGPRLFSSQGNNVGNHHACIMLWWWQQWCWWWWQRWW